MLRSYVTAATRAMRRHLSYTTINVLGLSVGIAACLLIALFVRHELSYDDFHRDADRIYRVVSDWGPAATWPMIRTIEQQNPSLTVAPFFETSAVVNRDAHRFHEDPVFVARPSFFEVFTFSVKRGRAREAFRRPYTAALTPEMAQKYFGEANPVGKTLEMKGLNWGRSTVEVTVTGLLEPIPDASHFHPRIIVSWATLDAAFDFTEQMSDDSGGGFRAYLKVPQGQSPNELPETFTRQGKKRLGDDWRGSTLTLQPLTAIHLHSHLPLEIEPNGSATTVYLFVAIAFFILLLACVNFVNLAVARSLERQKEIGVRKTIGAGKNQIVRQFLAETFVLAWLALSVAVALTVLALPLFQTVTGIEAELNAVTDPFAIAALVGITIVAALGAASYPAFVLSRFDPSEVLGSGSRGTARGFSGSGFGLRKGLVVFQFVTAVALIAGTVVVYWQLDYVQKAELGFDEEQVVTLPMPPGAKSKSRSRTFEQEVSQNLGVKAVSKASEPLPSTLQASGGFAFADLGIPREDFHKLRLVTVGRDFFETLGVEPVAGRTFTRGRSPDSSAVVLNRPAFEMLASDLASDEQTVGNALGQRVTPSIGWLGERTELIGVVEDLHLTSLHRAIEPTAFVLNSTLLETYYLRVDASDAHAVLSNVESVWNQVFPDAPFDYTFADQSFAAAYRADRRAGTLFAVFAALALFVACLGLFGLAAFAARQRRQEIGVRKAVGASTRQVVGLLSKEFAQLVAGAIVIAVPLAYVGLRQWLDTFAYHVELGAGAFLLAGSCVLLVSLLTVSTQALRAARVDPATTLRED